MDRRNTDGVQTPRQLAELEDTAFCWKELLDRAFAGFAPTDQTVERMMDRVEGKKR